MCLSPDSVQAVIEDRFSYDSDTFIGITCFLILIWCFELQKEVEFELGSSCGLLGSLGIPCDGHSDGFSS